MDMLNFMVPTMAANFLSENFSGNREIQVLDVICGTGKVAKQVTKASVVKRLLQVDICQFVLSFRVFSCVKLFDLGFRRLVGVDSSNGLLEQAAKTGLFQDLRLAMRGPEPLPAETGILLSEIQQRTPLPLLQRTLSPISPLFVHFPLYSARWGHFTLADKAK